MPDASKPSTLGPQPSPSALNLQPGQPPSQLGPQTSSGPPVGDKAVGDLTKKTAKLVGKSTALILEEWMAEVRRTAPAPMQEHPFDFVERQLPQLARALGR